MVSVSMRFGTDSVPLDGRPAIATLHLMCGMPCSGKTTLAKQIERDAPAVRLTADEWLMRLLDSEPSNHPAGPIRDRLEGLLFDHALRLLAMGVDVVLDYGVWSRSEREDFRARAAAVRARTELRFLDVSLDDLIARLPIRKPAWCWIANWPTGASGPRSTSLSQEHGAKNCCTTPIRCTP